MTIPIIYSRPHDKVHVRVINEDEFRHFPSDWSNIEIENWIFREKDRKSLFVLRREIKVQSRELYVAEI